MPVPLEMLRGREVFDLLFVVGGRAEGGGAEGLIFRTGGETYTSFILWSRAFVSVIVIELRVNCWET